MPGSSCFAYDGLATEVSSLSRKGYDASALSSAFHLSGDGFFSS
jgi:hypothetical protein